MNFEVPSQQVPQLQEKLNSYMLGGIRFDLPNRYTPIKYLGNGSFGIVIGVNDNLTGKQVAIKKMSQIFDNSKESKRILREIRLMRHFKHENILSINEILPPLSKSLFNDIYIVTELMGTDLHTIIYSKQNLTEDHVQSFIYQILKGLKAIHSANVLHRDLKPSNILVNENCLIKICDFGLARVNNPSTDWNNFLTEYVATRWYRAPEVILSWKQYTKSIDVWSVGCIFAELLGKRPLFQGKNYLDQVSKITDILGTPPPEEMQSIQSEMARGWISQMGFKPKIPFSKLFPNVGPLAIDLLEKLLAFDHTKRISVEEALAHPYLTSWREPSEETTCEIPFNFDFEQKEIDKETFRELLWQEILCFHPECRYLT